MESPGTAPGSDPLITSAFMFIVPKDRTYIGVYPDRCNHHEGNKAGSSKLPYGQIVRLQMRIRGQVRVNSSRPSVAFGDNTGPGDVLYPVEQLISGRYSPKQPNLGLIDTAQLPQLLLPC